MKRSASRNTWRLAVGLLIPCAVLCFAAGGLHAEGDGKGKSLEAKDVVSKEGKETAPMPDKGKNPRVRVKTTAGDIVLELDPEKAPRTVENFLQYVKDGSYNGTIFHRVIAGFMIQGGGFEPGMKQRPTRSPIPNEAHNGLKNRKGTIAMARTNVVNSATSQFFINCTDNAFLDHRSKDPQGYGYAVFGKVVEGMAVVEDIERVPTGVRGGSQDVPLQDVVIQSVTVESAE